MLADRPGLFKKKSRKTGRKVPQCETLTYPGSMASTKHQYSLYWSVLEGNTSKVGSTTTHSTMLDQGPPCFGHLAKSPFLVYVMVLAKLNFQDDLDKYINLQIFW